MFPSPFDDVEEADLIKALHTDCSRLSSAGISIPV
jgi:hypothetical protein